MDREEAVELVRGLVAIPSLSRQEGAAARGSSSRCAAPATIARSWTRPATRSANSAIPTRAHDRAARPHRHGARQHSGAHRGRPRCYGRGSVDAKGPLATFVGGARALRCGGARGGACAWWWSARSKKKPPPARARDSSRRASTARGARTRRVHHRRAEPLASRHARLQGPPAAGPRRPTADGAHRGSRRERRRRSLSTCGTGSRAHAAEMNDGKDKAFDQLSPSLRRFITATNDEMHDTVDAQIAWRLPVGFDVEAFVKAIETGHRARPPANGHRAISHRDRSGFTFRGYEQPWRGDRNNALVRSFLAGSGALDAGRAAGLRREDRHQRHERGRARVAVPDRRLRSG